MIGPQLDGIGNRRGQKRCSRSPSRPSAATDGQIVGDVLVVGYDLSNDFARAEGKRLGGHDVAFLVGRQGLQLVVPRERLPSSFTAFLFGAGEGATKGAMGGNVSPPWENVGRW